MNPHCPEMPEPRGPHILKQEHRLLYALDNSLAKEIYRVASFPYKRERASLEPAALFA